MSFEFVSIIVTCTISECPNFGIETSIAARLDAHGCLPWIVCGVCRTDLNPHPHPGEPTE